MSMSTHVIGLRPPDERWQKMREVWDACLAAQVELPAEVDEFFGHDRPDPGGVEVEIEPLDCVRDWSDDRSREGFEVQLDQLPKYVTVIRFYNSW